MDTSMKKVDTFTLENAEQIIHFKTYRANYLPLGLKMFSCRTEVYHDDEDGKTYYRTIVDVFSNEEYDGDIDIEFIEEMPDVPTGEEPE